MACQSGEVPPTVGSVVSWHRHDFQTGCGDPESSTNGWSEKAEECEGAPSEKT